MSGPILDCVTGGNCRPAREELPVEGKALRFVPPFEEMPADTGSRRGMPAAADANLSTGQVSPQPQSDGCRARCAVLRRGVLTHAPIRENASGAPVPRPCHPKPIPRHTDPPCPLQENPDILVAAPIRVFGRASVLGHAQAMQIGGLPSMPMSVRGTGAVTSRRAAARPPERACPRLR